jgi:hypothetical protein
MSLPPQTDSSPAAPSPNKEMLDIGLPYAWNWADSHNKSITQQTNFLLLISAFVVTAYLTALINRVPVFAVAVAIAAAASSILFLLAIRQLQDDLTLGERALIKLEKVIAEELGIDELRLAMLQRSDAERRFNKILARWSTLAVLRCG